jgi:hypothetical protein
MGLVLTPMGKEPTSMSIPRRQINWKQYDAFEGTDADFARSIGMSPGLFHTYKKTRYRDEPPTIVDVPVETVELAPTSNGNLPAIPSAHSDAPERISALPMHYDASELDDLKSRLATLEAFMAAVQAQQRISALPAHPNAPVHYIAPERTEPPTWKSQGQQFAEDTLQRLDQYARQSRREKREIIDTALRAYLPPMASEEVPDA